jgi:hypothetical protein
MAVSYPKLVGIAGMCLIVGTFAYQQCEESERRIKAERAAVGEQRQRDEQRAKAADESTRLAAAERDAQEKREAGARRGALVSKYTAMTAPRRLAEVLRLCPVVASRDHAATIEEMLAGTCVTDETNALLTAVRATPEEKTISDALDQARKRREREESEASRMLQCCDGNPSDDCTCRNPVSGCCSHHGGVCGCAPAR